MRIAVLFSSGKDSTFTFHYYRMQGWDVACLCTLLPENPDSFMFQSPLKELVLKQAEALDVPVLFQHTTGEEEKELMELDALLRQAKESYNIEGVAVGALASDYQHVRVNHICERAELRTFSPLWHKDQLALLREMVHADFDIRITRVAAQGLDESWLGKRLDMRDCELLAALRDRFGFHPGGEGGEYETIVLDGPLFQYPLHIEFEKRMESKERGELIVTAVAAAPAHLAPS